MRGRVGDFLVTRILIFNFRSKWREKTQASNSFLMCYI